MGGERGEEGGLAGADQEGEASGGGEEAGGQGEDGFEALDGPEGDELDGREAEGLGALGHYIYVRQCKCPGHFAEEGGLLVIRLDQGQADRRGPDLHRQAGEAGAGTDVEDMNGGRGAGGSGQEPVVGG